VAITNAVAEHVRERLFTGGQPIRFVFEDVQLLILIMTTDRNVLVVSGKAYSRAKLVKGFALVA